MLGPDTSKLTLYIHVLEGDVGLRETLGNLQRVGVVAYRGNLPYTALIPVGLVGERATILATAVAVLPAAGGVTGSARDGGSIEPVLSVGQLGDFVTGIVETVVVRTCERNHRTVVALVLQDVLQTLLGSYCLSAPSLTLTKVELRAYVEDVELNVGLQSGRFRLGYVNSPGLACYGCQKQNRKETEKLFHKLLFLGLLDNKID